MADLQLSVVAERVVVQPFGADLLTPLVARAEDAADRAETAANDNALGLVIPALPTPADLFGEFAKSLFYDQGAAFLTFTDWLAGVSGSFARSGSATYVDSAGHIATASANAPRFTHDPVTLAPLGLLYEPAGANLWPWSNKGNAGGGSGWLFSPQNVTITDNNATGRDGTSSAFTVMETAANGAHQAFYYPLGALTYVTAGHFYSAEITFKPINGRTKYALGGNAATGMPSSSIDLGAKTATNGWTVTGPFTDGYYSLSCRFTGAGAGTDVVYFTLAILNASGSASYAGDPTKGFAVDNIMFSEIASLTSSLPSQIYRPDASAATRAADVMTLTLPATVSKVTYTFDDNTKQVVPVSPGAITVPTSLNRQALRGFISVDITTASVAVTNVSGHAGPTVNLVQADITGLKTTDSPTFVSLVTSGKTQTLGASYLQQDGALSLWSPTTSTGWNGATDRAVIIGRSQARPDTWSNSILIGPDTAAGTAIAGGNVSTSVVIGDTAAASGLTISGSVCIGNEAGNGGVVSGSNIIGNTTKGGAYSRCDIVGQNALNRNAATDSVVLGNGAGGGTGSAGQVNTSVIIGSGAGANLGNGNTTAGNIIIGYNIAAPSASTSNYLNLGNALKGDLTAGVYVLQAKGGGIPTLQWGTGGAGVFSGTGSPAGVVTAPVGSIFLRTDGGAGTTLYVKESGTGNTGWVAK